MILLDTNVVSAIMSVQPPATMIDWLNAQETATLFLSTVTIGEIGYGLFAMPDGRKRRELERRFEEFVATGFEQRVLAFDEPAARLYGEVMGQRRAMGRPMGVADGQIASIARAKSLAVATRNVRDFEECGLELVNPFEKRR